MSEKNVKSETVISSERGEFPFFSSPLIEAESRGGYFWSWNFCVFREQYTPRLRIFFESFMFCHFHVLRFGILFHEETHEALGYMRIQNKAPV